MAQLNQFQIITVFPDATASTTKALSAGTTDVNSSAIDLLSDMQLNIIIDLGVVTATGTGTFKLQRSNDGSTWTDITGATFAWTDAHTLQKVAFVVSQCTHRYVRIGIDRNTANTAISGIVALALPRNQAVTQVTTANQNAGQPVVVAGTWA